MKSFAELREALLEEIISEELLNEIFDKAPESERDSFVEPMLQFMVPKGTKNIEAHKVSGMSDMHRVIHFDAPNGMKEFHIMHLGNHHGKLEDGDIDHKNAQAAYGHIIHHVKKTIDNGQSVKIQAREPRQYRMYKSAVDRMIKRNPDKAEVTELGVRPTVQGMFKAHTLVIEPK